MKTKSTHLTRHDTKMKLRGVPFYCMKKYFSSLLAMLRRKRSRFKFKTLRMKINETNVKIQNTYELQLKCCQLFDFFSFLLGFFQ